MGSALLRCLRSAEHRNIVLRTHAELDLIDAVAVHNFFSSERPEYVFLAAARVGGIHANSTYPAEFIYQNLAIQLNVIHAAYVHGVKKLLFLGSSCIYPKHAPQPMKEEYLLTGKLEPTNSAYAMAKISGIEMCAAYNRQYGTNFISTMPTNVYGPGDNYHPQNSHVVSALIHKMHDAKVNGSSAVTIWGTGAAKREFLYSDDLADACVFLMQQVDAQQIGEFINIGIGRDISIRELSELVAKVVGFPGELVFDSSRPDGMPRKLLDVSRMQALGWSPQVELSDGLAMAYEHYLSDLQQAGTA